MIPQEVANQQFAIVLGGYSRAQVRFFLSELARQMGERDAEIRRLNAELAAARGELPAGERAGRAVLLRHLGRETAAILQAADASAARIRADAEATAHRVREGLRAVGSNLGDVHQLMGELVSIMQGMAGAQETAPSPAPAPFEAPAEYEPPRAVVPGSGHDHELEILLPDDGGEPRFG